MTTVYSCDSQYSFTGEERVQNMHSALYSFTLNRDQKPPPPPKKADSFHKTPNKRWYL